MTDRKFHERWIEQCDAADAIRSRYGVKAAFDYLVAEKLANFIEAATTRPEVASELPKFVAHVRATFTPLEIGAQLGRLEREERQYALQQSDFDDLAGELSDADKEMLDGPADAMERAQRFALIRELLTATAVGTS